MSIELIIAAVGERRQHVLGLPETLTFTVTRQDDFAPSEMEILTAMRMYVGDRMKKKKRPMPSGTLGG